jgi:hypothetical protein
VIKKEKSLNSYACQQVTKNARPLYNNSSEILKRALATVILCSLANTAMSEEYYDVERAFGDWGAYRDGNDCWIVTHPLIDVGNPWEDAFFYVTFHDLLPVPSISILFTIPVNEERGISVQLDDQALEFTFVDGIAYPDKGEDIPFLKSMIASERLMFEVSRADGGVTAPSISYDGFRDAYNYLSRACDLRIYGDFRIDEWTDVM